MSTSSSLFFANGPGWLLTLRVCIPLAVDELLYIQLYAPYSVYFVWDVHSVWTMFLRWAAPGTGARKKKNTRWQAVTTSTPAGQDTSFSFFVASTARLHLSQPVRVGYLHISSVFHAVQAEERE